MQKVQKKRVNWRRLSVRVSREMYDELKCLADAAGVSVSRLVFGLLKRKKITIVPGFLELVRQIEQICKELGTAKNDPAMLARLIEDVNRVGKMVQQTVQEVPYPYLLRIDGKYKPSTVSKDIKNNGLFEGVIK